MASDKQQSNEQPQRESCSFTACPPAAAERPAASESVAPISPIPAARFKVLLVDDNRANRLVATCILEERGHLIEAAGDGSQAIRLAQANRYDVILMDVEMPGMDGLEATAAIRAAEELLEPTFGAISDGASRDSDFSPPSPVPRRVPIVAMTAHALPEDRARCLAAGMDGYLVKPLDAPGLIALVEGLASGQRRD